MHKPPFIHEPSFQAWLGYALAEDVGTGDVTSALLMEADRDYRFVFRARQPLVVAGLFLLEEVLQLITTRYHLEIPVQDGDWVEPATPLALLQGNARDLLTAERLMLNLLQRCSGVATLTHHYVQAITGTGVALLDTRKTMPSMRLLDKYAVQCGGGQNHRMRLDDRILIKDNHIAVCGTVTAAIAKAKAGNHDNLLIEVECDTLAQVAEAAATGVDWLLLDNMPPAMLREAVTVARRLAPRPLLLEASGGVTLHTIRSIAETGVDAISVGAITHSTPAVDIGLDIASRY
jgi:nicotinate-nucleotide pyrophosphorylase (carboxylating)